MEDTFKNQRASSCYREKGFMSSNNVQPVFILRDDSEREMGKSAQKNNILAATLVADTVRTTLGPKGMDKMLVDSVGHVTVTNDGVTILEEMDIAHPAAKMVVEVARTQEDEVGDGTTTAVILAGEFLRNAQQLLDDKIHPTNIIRGYRLAQKHALRVLAELQKTVAYTDTQTLLRIAETAMTGKGAESAKDTLASLVVQAVQIVAEKSDIDLANIKIESRVGGSIENSRLIQGIVLDKERIHPNMPVHITDAHILLLDTSLEIKETELDAKISITDPAQLQNYFALEDTMLQTLISRVEKTGANVVFCQKGVDDLVAYQLAKKQIMVVRRVNKSDLEKLSRATGASIISDSKDASSSVLGHAGVVEQKRVGEQPMIFVEECKNPRAVTLLVRAGTEHVVAEISRAVTDAVGDVRATLLSKSAVSGAGSIEMALSVRLHAYAKELSGREQLAVQAYAQSLEVIPRTLAENAGLDPIDVLADLRSAHAKQPTAGIDVFSGKVVDAWNTGVIEPARIKEQALNSATDVATMILRIDDVIKAGSSPASSQHMLDE